MEVANQSRTDPSEGGTQRSAEHAGFSMSIELGDRAQSARAAAVTPGRLAPGHEIVAAAVAREEGSAAGRAALASDGAVDLYA